MNTYKNYINLLRNILKNFDDKFDYIIKNILIKVFDEYYIIRDNYVWCIDNLYKKFYVAKYNKLKKRYGSIKKDDLIFRFNMCNKKAYIIKLLKDNFRVILDKSETYDSISDTILQTTGINNYKRYIDNMFINREIDRNMFIEIDLSVKKACNDNNVNIKKDNIFENKICFYSPCLNCVSGDNYCHLHNKDMI